MLKSVKFRIYPNMKQQAFIDHTLKCSRFVYNRALALRKKTLNSKRKAGFRETCDLVTRLKKASKFAYLKKADSIALVQAVKDLDIAFRKYEKKKAKFPCFKNLDDQRLTYRTRNQNGTIRIIGNHIRLPKAGLVKCKKSMEVGRIHNATVVKTATGKYFAILCVDFQPENRLNKGNSIGIDVGIKVFYTDSNGNKVSNPANLEKLKKKLTRERRKLSRKTVGSKNYIKQQKKTAKVYEKITNRRNDFLQKQTTMLLRENQIVCIENLNIKNMKHNHKLANRIASASWSTFFAMLVYKANWYGNSVRKVPNNYTSSQTCSCCGYTFRRVKTANLRYWECPNCHAKHDRDINASINILKKGLEKA